MNYNNPQSCRKNPLREIYDSDAYNSVLKHRDTPVKFPFLVDIEPTNKCNLKCIFCTQNIMKREKGFMDEALFRKIVDECAIYTTPIRICGFGEPFLHPKIIDFCRYIKSKGLLLQMTNNGLALKERDIQAIIDIGVDFLIFSFQGATKDQYETMRNNSQYEKLEKNIRRLVELRGTKEKPFIHISSTMTSESKEEIEKFVQYWGNIVDSVGTGKTNFSIFGTGLEGASKEFAEKIRKYQDTETIKKTYRPCTEVYQKVTIGWDGNVSCCCGDYDDLLIIGDVNKSSISDIWNSSMTLKHFRGLLDKRMHKSLTLCSTCYHPYDEI